MEDDKRTEKFKKNISDELFLAELNDRLEGLEQEMIQSYSLPQKSVVFIVGTQRSGSTLLMQLLTGKYRFSYPNNFIARFWKAPVAGARLFKTSVENYLSFSANLSSELGYTGNLNGPHEFGYFWRRWFPDESFEKGTTSFDAANFTALQKELAAWEQVTGDGLIFKNLIVNSFYIKELFRIFSHSLFVHIHRPLPEVIVSSYESRIKLYNDPKLWFGLKPSTYPAINRLPVWEQITAQVVHTQQEINRQLAHIPEKNKLTVDYYDLVSNPGSFFDQFEAKMDALHSCPQRISDEVPKLYPAKKEIKPGRLEELTAFIEKYQKL